MAKNKKKTNVSGSRTRSKNNEVNGAVLTAAFLVCAVVIIALALIVIFGKNTPDDTTTHEPETEVDSVSGGVTDEITSDTNPSDNDTSNDTTETPETTIQDNTTSPGYDVRTEKETTQSDIGNITMQYPVVEPDNESEIDAETINAIIREYMDEKRKEEQLESGDPDLDSEYVYKITSTDVKYSSKKFLSIVITGEYYITDSAHPTIFCYSINCDMESGELITPDTLIRDFSTIRSLFTKGKFTLKQGQKNLLEQTNYEDIILQYRPEYGIYPDIYFTGDSFGMVIELVFALGGYALFQVPTSLVSNAVILPW
ncbi:MAG: hypothetical protein WBI55_01685 [Eubacteriales bacterium]|mgnify:CR=1 FL=1|jgi:hypothetical protein|nr:DUF4163 domain-containing protein [Clostridiales bacterium]